MSTGKKITKSKMEKLRKHLSMLGYDDVEIGKHSVMVYAKKISEELGIVHVSGVVLELVSSYGYHLVGVGTGNSDTRVRAFFIR